MNKREKIIEFLYRDAYGGHSPTVIARGIGLRNSSYVARTLAKLVEEGVLYRMEYDDKPTVVYGINPEWDIKHEQGRVENK